MGLELEGNGGDNEGESSEGGMTAVGGGRRGERSNLVFLAGGGPVGRTAGVFIA